MSRGGWGRGRGGGGGRKGPAPPELDYEDDADISFPPTEKKPQALFPDIDLPVPRPPTARELAAVSRYLSFRTRVRNGPYYATLDPSSIADEKTGKTLKRAGFDPFNDQEKYTAKYHKKKRSLPDLKGSGREYALKYFPHELWPLLDPDRKNPLWKSAEIDIDAATNIPRRKSSKRKRDSLVIEDHDEEGDEVAEDDKGNDTDESDPLLSASRRARALAKAAKKRRRRETESREKRGLDAEDDFGPKKKNGRSPLPASLRAKERKRPQQETGRRASESDEEEEDDDDVPDAQENEDEDGDGDEEEDEDDTDGEPVDSEFEESDDGEADDYNAENYFDGGEGDDEDGFAYGGGGGDEGGEY
ncbi:uncharacterized protein Z519_02292 [Cladophialophora bantiana CBS 173.52]|uniref:DNA-directed RNA polymerase III subunit n=1 Tax=Cladophialophora bantiana (strain ATCC 10958 / CBS 173.52 / CDC B-1940 / NIH 8579) TaxID=1442370 RepID=A0A0D2F3T8_CLAB1|nr:uncharacterized protein Z519_02292 [Cladophialophora bantiana CBS 173.52]KIW96901.1 hypothetical protein Z519_02292 [Cladophialophora bantiana CBS 173.52]